MKRYTQYILLALLSALFFSACDLNRFPKDSIPADGSFSSVADAQKWHDGIMDSFRDNQRGEFDYTQERMSDLLFAASWFGNRGGNPYGWVTFHSGDYDLRDVYHGYYEALKNINYTFEHSASVPVADANEQAILDKTLGVAHFARAYYYFNLALRFGKPYDSATAATDLSVPLVLKYNATELPSRATNEQVYAKVLEDLAKAKEKLANVEGQPGAQEITIDACLALEARIKLHMKDWQGALTAAKKLIDGGKYPLVAPTQENFVQMWHGTTSSLEGSTEEILQLKVEWPDEDAKTMGPIYVVDEALAAKAGKAINTPDWLPAQWVVDLFVPNDLRRNVYFESRSIQHEKSIWDNIMVISKFKGSAFLATNQKPSLWADSYLPDGKHAPKVFRIAEIYLIAAEAAYKLNKETDAANYLKTLQTSRGLTPGAALTGEALFKEIQDERTRELAFEGFRFWDLRRWGMDMVRRAPQALPNGESPFISESAKNLHIEPSHPKWVWGIPQNEINTNPNIKPQNPGW